MHWLTVTGIRCRRKCRSCLLLTSFVLLLMWGTTAQVSARPQDEQVPPVPDEQLSALNDEYEYDVDNVEFHQAKLVDGVLHEDHPVIMYKEDFVSEDYDPKKARSHSARGARKHKNLLGQRRRRLEEKADTEHAGSAEAGNAAAAAAAAAGPYHALKPEKIYFDILSTASLVNSDETKDAAVSDTSKVHVEFISLADDIDVNNAATSSQSDDTETKQALLHKRPKKYHRRQRRDTADALAASASASGTHAIQKRNPYLRYTKASSNANSINAPSQTFPISYLPPVIASRFASRPVAGEYYNGPVNTVQVALETRFGGINNTDRVIWRDYTPTKNPNARLNKTRGTPAPLFPQRTTERPTPVTRRPAPIPNRTTQQPPLVESGTVYNTVNDVGAQDRFESSDQSLTSCVWAIAGCCSGRDNTVRYSCFERYGCNLVFWNLNPCAEKTRDSIVDYLNNQFD